MTSPATTFQKSSTLAVPASAAFDWHCRPGAFERLIPPWERVRILHRSGGISNQSRVTLSIKTGPLPLRWIAEHRDVVGDIQFRDVQIRGPFASWDHLHRFESLEGDSSCLHDIIEYRLPLGPLGKVVAGKWIRSQLEAMFQWRHEVTRRDLARVWSCRHQPPLKILISGAQGLVGQALVPLLSCAGHEVWSLSRRFSGTGVEFHSSARDHRVVWDPAQGELAPALLEGFDAVIHLAGENVFGLWTESKKREILQSRLRGTALLSRTLAQLHHKPRVFLCASAIGFYGHRPGQALTESSPPGTGFFPDSCQGWEQTASPATEAGIRTVNLRFGVVLTPRGGALGKMLPAFSAGLGGAIGTGSQQVSWISIEDVISAIDFCLREESVSGPVNLTAPHPVSNGEFTATLARILRRPALLPVPGAVRLLPLAGEMIGNLLLTDAMVLPQKLTTREYPFIHPRLEDCLRSLLGRELPPQAPSRS
ncbi:MAG: TIGR01777 family oxidoreductase [Verrucomicrobiae bacterium]|nr:TIGR01777 family oxidoreductase [Verrucomicrobiae bacterium]